FEVFLELLEPLGEVVDVVLETSHEADDGGHHDLVREQIESTVLLSNLYDFEDLLLNDGCTGLAVIATDRPMEVQFDEHKLLVIYARDLRPFGRILEQAGVHRADKRKLLPGAERLPRTDARSSTSLQHLRPRLC